MYRNRKQGLRTQGARWGAEALEHQRRVAHNPPPPPSHPHPNDDDAAASCGRGREDLDFFLHTEGVTVGDSRGLGQGFQDQLGICVFYDFLLFGRRRDLDKGIIFNLYLNKGSTSL